ncbi:uncharacterized protein LOC126995486 [Eriocheir sinensis]|uniref:uncharacterized protein LOC126995486 n=1 Tax=Eriocheir sinensis TaxID=95602 RepID=UPI0021C7843B|nr:uncharacterized protein LOC126995486 [Eriocheir sinensis]XP_050711025.1 uncharacterized protein LOC126995486 [Eriocheir sinensis]XP_050711026.1 uncharacterized protein LOC126995486 [Eriocheir sinensis]
MAPKPWLLPRAAVLKLLLLLLLLLQADPLNGEAETAHTASSADFKALPSLTSFPFNLLDAVTRRPRQIRFKNSYLELPVGLRGLVGIRGLGHLSYFVQVDVPVTPPLSKALDRLPEGTKTYFPPHVSLLGAAVPEGVMTDASKRPSVSKTLGSSGGKARITIIPIKNLSQVNDNELDTLLSTPTVSTLLETDGGLSATPSVSTSSNLTTSPHNASYTPSGISWLPEPFNFLRASPPGVSSAPPGTSRVTTAPTTYVAPTPATVTHTTTSFPSRVTNTAPLTSSLSSSFLSSYFFSIFSTTTPTPFTQHTESSLEAATTPQRLSNSTPRNSYLSKKHFKSQAPSPSSTPPLTRVTSTPKTTTPAPSSSTSSRLRARYPPQAKPTSAASSFPLIKKHSSALKSFALPSTPSTSSQSFAFPSPPSYPSVKSRAPSSSKASPPPRSLAPPSTTFPSKHAVKYAKFTPTSSPVKSVKILTPPSTESSSLRPIRPLRTTSFPSVNLPKPPFQTTSGTNRIGQSAVSPPTSSVSSTARPILPKYLRRPTTASPRPPLKKHNVPSRSPRPLSSKDNFSLRTPQASRGGLSSSPSSRLLARTRGLSTQSSFPSFKHTAASPPPNTPPTKPKHTAVGTNPKTFSSISARVLQSLPSRKQGKVTRDRDNDKKRVGDRLDGEIVGTGGIMVKGEERGSGGKGRGGKGGSEEGRREGKAVRRTLGEIMLERKLQLARLKGGGKGVVDQGSRPGRLQEKNQPDRGNRVVADGQRGDLPAPRTTPQPDGRTRHRDGRTHDNDDDDDDDNVSVPKRGSPTRMRISSVVPRTSFSCPDEAKGEYFADRETGCQVFHVCWGKRRAAFLCPEGTLFNQLVQVCDWWYNVDCDAASEDGKKRQSAADK